ncbi:hypothetical protein D1007_31372 [Hordeum vulgare]|nr:hypothetical protein D1007_31372 [Hordeum vulgare]
MREEAEIAAALAAYPQPVVEEYGDNKNDEDDIERDNLGNSSDDDNERGWGRRGGGRMIEKMNKTGVFYRTGNMEEEEENLYDDINESTHDSAFRDKEFVYHSDMDDYRSPFHRKMSKQKDDDGGDVNSHGKAPYYCTPEYLGSFKGDKNDPIKVPDVSDEKAVTSLETNEISSHGSGHSNGVDEQVEEVLGKRKNNASKAVKSPFVVVKPIKNAKRSAKAKLFSKEDVKKSIDDVDVIKASVQNGKNDDRNDYETVSNKNEPMNRCLNEYFKTPKAYMFINKDDTHWVTVVMHKEKEEFQVLDSLMGKELDSRTRKLVEDMRREIEADIAEANATGSV